MFLLLFFNLDDPYLIMPSIKKIIIILFWMSIVGALVILIDFIFVIPDEITGAIYFLGIGIAASSVLNYYR